MPIKRYKAEQIVMLLRQIEVEIANGSAFSWKELAALKLSSVIDRCLTGLSVSKAAFNQKFRVRGGMFHLVIHKVHAQGALKRV